MTEDYLGRYHLNLELKKAIIARNPKNPAIGKSVFKFAKSVMVCCLCYTEVVISGFTEKGIPTYKCDHSSCPSYGMNRNKQQWKWLEYQQSFMYRKWKVISKDE